MKITGFDELSRKLRGLSTALGDLDGNVANVSFNPFDPQDIERAIAEASDAIDAKVARSNNSELVAGVVAALKENARKAILDRAAAARLEQDESSEQ